MLTSIEPLFNFFPKHHGESSIFVNYPALQREIISNSESGRTENELGLKTQYGLLESSRGSLEISVPPNRLVRKVFLFICFAWENHRAHNSNTQGVDLV